MVLETTGNANRFLRLAPPLHWWFLLHSPSTSPLWCYSRSRVGCIVLRLCWVKVLRPGCVLSPSLLFQTICAPPPVSSYSPTWWYFKPTNTLRQLLVHPKDPVGKDKVVGPVYKISCEENEATYVGETERSLKARFGEHRRPSSTTSEVSKHIHTDSPDHTIMLENTKILEVEHKWFERGVKEAIHIRALKPSLNRDGGRYNLPPTWNNIIKERLTESAMGTTSGGGAQSEESVSVPGRL